MMKRLIGGIVLCIMICASLSAEVRVVPSGGSAGSTSARKGGCAPGAIACCIGPRVGLEMNEGKPVQASEWLRLLWIGYAINGLQAYQQNGCVGCLLDVFFGARIGRQLDKRNVRTLEWLAPFTAGITNLIMAFEAYEGKTMTEVERQEHLKK